MNRLKEWRILTPSGISDMFYLLHSEGSGALLTEAAAWDDLYAAPGPKFRYGNGYASQAEVALYGLSGRQRDGKLDGEIPEIESALLTTMSILANWENEFGEDYIFGEAQEMFDGFIEHRYIPQNVDTRRKFVSVTRKLAERMPKSGLRKNKRLSERSESIEKTLNVWADLLESSMKDANTSLKSDKKAEGR